MKKYFSAGLLFCFVMMLSHCLTDAGQVNIPSYGQPFAQLSEYGLFTGDMEDFNLNERVIRYEVNTSLFSDYAEKNRYLYVPNDQSIQYILEGVLDLPLKSILVKTFFYPNRVEGQELIETRLLIHHEQGWEGYTYVWDENHEDAKLSLVGGVVPLTIDHDNNSIDLNYIIPNKNQCKSCHTHDDAMQPIGLKIANLNKALSYPSGTWNQLEYWESIGILSGCPPGNDIPHMAIWDDPTSGSLHERAMAYLDVNCGHCHNPHGPGGTTGLNLVYEAAQDINLGIHKAVVAAGRGSGGHKYSIVPGHPETSVMPFRMQSNEVGVMMPELGRTIAHAEGVELIAKWIAEM